MNVCTHAPNFYDKPDVVAECAAIQDKQACLDTGRCLFNDCFMNPTTATAPVTTSTGVVPAAVADVLCPDATQ